MSIYSRQPYKAIWTAIIVLSLLIRIPFIALYFIPTASRPHREWTYRQAIGRQLLRIFLVYASTVELKFPLSLDPGSEKERFVRISPAASEFYQRIPGDSKPAIQPIVIGATWFPKLYNPTNDNVKNIILHFHGGGYVLGGSRDTNCNYSANNLINATSAMVLFLQYRLASSPGGEFPAAFQDAVTAYTYLLHDLGIAPSRITISGDSVGAHLAVTLLRYISQTGSLLPAPRAALLWSPWFDLSIDPVKDFDQHRNQRTDYIPSLFPGWAVRAFVPAGMSLTDPYISPLHHPFRSKTPVWIQVGGAEVLRDQGTAFAQGMDGVGNDRVEVYEVARAPHDIFLAGNIMGFGKEAADAVGVAQRFLESLTSRS